jgi:putative ABC transport system permease protein
MGAIGTIAFRNIKRHRGRTLRSAVTIGVALMFFIVLDSIMAGLDRGAIDNMIELSAAAVKVHTVAYQKEKEALPLDHGIQDFAALERAAAGHSRFEAIAPRARFLGQASNYEQSVPVIGSVVDPARDTLVFSVMPYLEGSYFSEGAHRQVILGAKLARDLGLEPGDWLTLYALTRYGSRNADEFEIAGVLNTSDPGINGSMVMIPYETANAFLDLDGLITEANIALERRVNTGDQIADAHEVKKVIQERISGIAARTFDEQGADFLAMSKQKRSFGIVLLAVILLIAAVGIFNSVLMSVYERVREVGVLRAHGMRAAEVIRMFALEGLFTGVLGSCIGVAAGAAANLALVTVGYPMDKLAGDIDTAGFPVWGTIYGEWNIAAFVFAFCFGVATATVAGLIPARQAGAMSVTRALRFV